MAWTSHRMVAGSQKGVSSPRVRGQHWYSGGGEIGSLPLDQHTGRWYLGNPWRKAYTYPFLNFLSTFPQLLKLFYCTLWNSYLVINKIPSVINLWMLLLASCFTWYLTFPWGHSFSWYPLRWWLYSLSCSSYPQTGGWDQYLSLLFISSFPNHSLLFLTNTTPSPSLNVKSSDYTTHHSSQLQSSANSVPLSLSPLKLYCCSNTLLSWFLGISISCQ